MGRHTAHVLPPVRPLHVLLVDDSEPDRMFAELAFEAQTVPHTFTTAASGDDALARLRVPMFDRPNLVLLDLNMPGLNGFEVLARLKAHPETRTVPVVVLTTSTSEQDQRRAYDLQASAYLVKPNSIAELMELVERLMIFWQIARLPRRAYD